MLDDHVLMQRVAENDPAAVAELYDRFGALVYRMAYQLLPTKAEAEDAVQEVFIRLWQSAGRYDPARARLATWVMLITRRHLVDQLRRNKVRPSYSGLDDSWPAFESATSSNRFGGGSPGGNDSPSRLLERDERREELLKKIEALPELQRQVVELAYLGGRTLREIGQDLNKPIGTVKSALSRALAGLRERIPSEESLP